MEEGLRALWPPVRKALPWVLAGAAAVGVVIVGGGHVRRRVSARRRFLIEPAGLCVRRVQQIGDLQVPVEARPVGLPARVSALDRGLATTLAAAFARHPWVEQVHAVRIRYPNKVKVSLTLRRPVAAVRAGDAYYWVDGEGVRLPGRLSSRTQVQAGLMFIRGVRGPVPEEGQPWTGPGVRAGAETALVLADDAKALDLTAIDVSNINGRQDPYLSEIVMLTSKYTRILWGRPPSTNRPGELAAEEKLRLLRAAAARGFLDTPGEVDIRFPNLAIDRPPRQG